MGHVEKVDRTLPLNEMLYHVRKDAELRRRWREDFDALAREFGLGSEEIEAVRQSDVRRLNDLGVHQYYVTQILRLTFGAAGASNTHPALEAFRRAYPESAG
jgi:Aromatic-ring-opening dioxygenase LigAB, LigA subunit